MMIQAKNIHKYYNNLQVLQGVDLEIKEKEIVSVVGASGAGKTTLLQILGTLDICAPNTDSELRIDSVPVLRLSSRELARFRNERLGYIFQFHQLLPEFTALENVCIPAFIKQTPKSKAESRATALLDYLGLSHRLNHKPKALSGGEQQRVAVARALINSPKVIFADEPSGNLDSESAAQLHDLFFKLRAEFGTTFLIVTHNPDLAEMADRKVTMVDGKILNS